MTETEEDERKDAAARPPKNCAAAVSRKMGMEELRRELEKVLATIANERGFVAETIQKAEVVLEAMRNARGVGDCGKSRPPPSTEGKKQVLDVPEEFVCPISLELMRDPVIVATGQTYDRPFIQTWLDSGNRTCPKTQQVLSSPTLIPNHLVGKMIRDWGKGHGISLPPHDKLDGVTVSHYERSQVDGLLKMLSVPSVGEQKRAAKELRVLTKRSLTFRALLGENSDTLTQLVSPLISPDVKKEHPDLVEDVVTTVLNLSIHESNKKRVVEHPVAIALLIDAVNWGEMETRRNAAAALFTLSALSENKTKMGEMGALGPLMKLLEEGSEGARKDAAAAIFSLCLANGNKSKAIGGGLVSVLLRCIAEGSLVHECLSILALVGSWRRALNEICDGDGVELLLGVIRDRGRDRDRDADIDSENSRENAAALLLSLSEHDSTTLAEIREAESDSGCISWLALNGTSRAQRKAAAILQHLNRQRKR